jgi:hypothetical protein
VSLAQETGRGQNPAGFSDLVAPASERRWPQGIRPVDTAKALKIGRASVHRVLADG